MDDPQTVLDRLEQAIARHDPDAMAALLHPDYRSEQPLHPGRGFAGPDQVARNWSELFTAVPDLRVEVLRSAQQGGEAWREWRVYGTRTDASLFDYRGIAVFGVHGGRIAWGRFYFDLVETDGGGIEAANRRLAAGG